ncbi:MAG TPA: 1,4-dihydroxy-2-naphthoate polyprenyltransferase [Actinotalea caeni]|uniref:1,4-dihydroxy-2-naphthoate polyprenyltransferase n=1 Tax=Actinotalea caeni TaxID=1348467 RepID=UPI0012E1E9D3|nr:1,4-dihydroxy-2-naphthoate polyprenyltransferase [Actinotalea caeni]HLV56714.1 1,4-dihydroxy-2-naphthoate polyprenyltransferase [Actinotalea caeni]
MPEPRPDRASLRDWLTGARVRTLPAAVAPVLAGTGAAAAVDGAHGVRALLAAGVALALQVGVNLANDYSDGIRGTDDHRVGPTRLTASGAVPPATVRRAAFAAFGVAAVLGLALCAAAGTWWLLAVGALCVVAAWYYTGGRNPYGYRGLGEVAVFVFFGLVATVGTTYTQALQVTTASVLAGAGVGAVACALLMANNIRDIPTDTEAGKRTLAVRLGDRRARWGYVGLLAAALVAGAASLPAAGVAPGWLALLLLPLALAAPQASRVLRGASGRELITVLRDTGLLELALGAVLGLALWLG